MIDFQENTIDLDLFRTVLKEVKNTGRLDIIDSFSDNQFLSKQKLLQFVHNLNVLDPDQEVIIFGCWYGSILIPALAKHAKIVTGIDLDDSVIKIAKNKFFKHLNADFITSDVFAKYRGRYSEACLFINTSCEHMAPMKEWPWWSQVKSGTGFAFQSNNMFDIEGHTNCVTSIDEFKDQLPQNFKILSQHELVEERGTRFTLVGKTQ